MEQDTLSFWSQCNNKQAGRVASLELKNSDVHKEATVTKTVPTIKP
jgi:hypothetical protein